MPRKKFHSNYASALSSSNTFLRRFRRAETRKIQSRLLSSLKVTYFRKIREEKKTRSQLQHLEYKIKSLSKKLNHRGQIDFTRLIEEEGDVVQASIRSIVDEIYFLCDTLEYFPALLQNANLSLCLESVYIFLTGNIHISSLWFSFCSRKL